MLLLLFADDTNLFFNSNSYEALYDVTNSRLKHVEAWLSANKLNLILIKPFMLRSKLQ